MMKNPLFTFFSTQIVRFYLIFGVMIGVFNWWMLARPLPHLWHQYQAASFPTTQGHVVSSRVVVRSGAKGSKSYESDFAYRYRVNHENFRGSWYLSYSNSDSAYSVEKAYPFGSSVTVYYNPKDPTDSVLLLGPDEAGINALFMGAGANLLWLWLLMACWGCDWPGKPMPVAGGVTIISRMMETRVRLPRFRPLDMGMLALGLLLLGGGFIVPSYVEADGLALAICGGFGIATIGGAAVYLAFLLIVLSGRQDLIIKQAERVLELPSTNGRWKRMTVPFSEITSVTLERVPQALGGRTFYSNVPTLDIRGRPPQRLTVFVVEARGQAFISWLQDKLDFEMGSEPDWEPGLEHVSSLQCRSAAKHPAEGE